MARIRSVKPEFWTDGDMLKLSRDARLFYIGLWNFVDDCGVIEGDPMTLKARVFPCDNIDVEQLITELESHRKILRYSNGDKKPWLLIKSFINHQVIDRPRKSNNPLPTEDQMKSIGINVNQLKSVQEGKGKEGKGGDIGPTPEIIRLIKMFNDICGTKYESHSKPTVELLSARLAEGYTISDFEQVIRHKYETWGNDPKMREYLRPSTLFRKSHMEDYLNAAKRHPKRRSDV